MFHLLVKFDGWAPSCDSLGNGRVFESTASDIVEHFKPKGTLDSERISRIPALFASESSRSGSQLARVGHITRARLTGTEVRIEYSFDPDFPAISNAVLEKLCGQLDIDGFELSRTHWAIKEADLFKVLFRNRYSSENYSKLFIVNEEEAQDDSLISVMMPFDARFDKIYQALKRMAVSLELKCIRADDIWEHSVVIQDIVSLIHRSRIVVCDCSGRNANVFYETGIAHSLGKEVLLITQSESDIPFDLRHLRYVEYLNNREGLQMLCSKLKQRIAALLA